MADAIRGKFAEEMDQSINISNPSGHNPEMSARDKCDPGSTLSPWLCPTVRVIRQRSC